MDDIELLFAGDGNTCYLESLSKCYVQLKGASPDILNKLEMLIGLELDLALAGTRKALAEVLGETRKDNIKPIK